MATQRHHRIGAKRLLFIFVFVSSLVLVSRPSVAAARTDGASRAASQGSLNARSQARYGWPVKPFHVQHPVRGFFGDPRISTDEAGHVVRQFHFGIDVSAPNGTAVYATLSGSISIDARHSDVVHVIDASGVDFSYWHIVPTVKTGQRAVAYETLIGHIERPWAHVHFSEARGGVYVNPLRPGAMGPFVDHERSTIGAVEVEQEGRPRPLSAVSGAVDLVVEASDQTPLAVPAPWANLPVVPTLVRWRLVGPRGVGSWKVAADFSLVIPPASAFGAVYAQWTRQNHANRPGRYRIFLAHSWNSTSVTDGSHGIQVETVGAGGMRNVRTFEIVVRNGRAR
jgi:hypothetical protein